MDSKVLTRKKRLVLGKMKPKWWTPMEKQPFSRKERARRRKKGRLARAARKINQRNHKSGRWNNHRQN